MEKLILIFCLINFISCIDFILKAGKKTLSHCDKDDLIFTYENCYFVNDIVPAFNEEFFLLLEDFYEAKCKINQMNFISSDFEILCSIENYFGCKEGNFEFPNYIKDEPNSIFLEDDNVLVFEGFSNKIELELIYDGNIEYTNILITAGDLFKIDCNNNEYLFAIYNSTSNVSITPEQEIVFNLSMNSPPNLTAYCSFPLGNRTFNINCYINNPDTLNSICNDDLIVKNDPDNTINNSYNIIFTNFTNLSNIIRIEAGKLKLFQEENENNTNIIFEDSNINYNLNNINFSIKYQINEDKSHTDKCFINNTNDIKCNITSLSSIQLQSLKIISDPSKDEINNPGKTLYFNGFKGKSIYYIFAGQLKKGKCEGSKYIFQFTNSTVPKGFNSKLFQMKQPNYKTNCSANSGSTTINCEISDSDEEQCLIHEDEEDMDIIVGSEEPGFIFDNDNQITIYFQGFANKETKTIEAQNISNKYIEGNDFIFIIKYNFDLVISDTFKFDMNFTELNHEQNLTANCVLNNENIKCSYDSGSLINGNNSDIIIKENPLPKELNISGKIYSLNFKDFENLTTYTIEAGNIMQGECNDNDFYEFSIYNNKIYNNLNNEIEIPFNLNLSTPNLLGFKCSIPININVSNEFNISCSKEISNCYETMMKNNLIIESNPDNLKNEEKIVFFKEFEGASTTVNIIAGKLNLSQTDNNYILKFLDSNIDPEIYELKNNLSFDLTITLNNKNVKKICFLPNDSKNIINCSLGDISSDNISIKISENPGRTSQLIKGKTVAFNQFQDKEVYVYNISGYLKEGNCSIDSTDYYYFYNFSFENITKVDVNYSFSLEMENIPGESKDALCNYEANNEYLSCYKSADESFCRDSDVRISVGKNDPKEKIVGNYILRFKNFKNQNTNYYNVTVGNLIKLGLNNINENSKYYFNFSEFEIIDADFIENEILFNIRIYFNDTLYNSTCKIYRNDDDDTNFLECYFELDESYSNLEELMGYDLNITDDTDGIVETNYPRKLNLIGFNNKKTITIFPEYIIDKSSNDEKLNFDIKTKDYNLDDLKGKSFNINFQDISNEIQKYDASCQVNNDSNNIINCSSTLKTSDTTIKKLDIQLISNPDYIPINDTNITYYFSNFTNLRTYSILASKVKKRNLNNKTQEYFFQILNCKSPFIPELKNISLNINISETEEKTAECVLQNKTNYAMSCYIKNISYIPFDIIMHENTIKTNTSLFSPGTTFFYDF